MSSPSQTPNDAPWTCPPMSQACLRGVLVTSSVLLAEQLTDVDFILFSSMRLTELRYSPFTHAVLVPVYLPLSYHVLWPHSNNAWSKKEDHHLAPTVRRMIERFNQVTQWIRSASFVHPVPLNNSQQLVPASD